MRKAFSPVVILCAVSAGFVGGVASQWWRPMQTVSAQIQAPRQMQAQRFVLVDPNGRTRGEFKMEGTQPEIVLYDRDGSVAWKVTAQSGRPHVTPMDIRK
ncbi:MAG TPA: hypothetical protein VLJ11_11560 [Bryobacteraceae bacterium]|nr:hypothetical protein [Bryobacteraceae bacterium]